ncbi:uncharacterized protein PgNI_03930 [Pyricularia grisea]|uniref:Major facilitator superfamily (MFS) profile domain-containing protein n=1 Tax=Pyricularia grisea TaxID=148305 RepID=A0A6P8B8B6_PYRGI|nr:uncharacterized protein PgNI_03930 [Pyricularia grisea]TLD12026.1 hypothetical protein PgNI_03930 [Pyricularia grisea]
MNTLAESEKGAPDTAHIVEKYKTGARESSNITTTDCLSSATSPSDSSDSAESTPVATVGAESIPDGGITAWLQVLGCFIIFAETWGLVNAFGVYQTYYETNMLSSVSSSSISWIGSVQGALLMMVSFVSGPLYDAGYFRHLIFVGLALLVLGQFLISFCSVYWQVLLAQGVMTGIGMGLIFSPGAAILAQYFHRRRALVLGLSSTGSPLVGITLPIIFSKLEPRIGFAWTTRTIAFILLALSAIPLACMHTRLPPSEGSRRRILDPTALHDAYFLTTVCASFFTFLTLFVPFFYLQLYAEMHGLASPDISPYVVTVLNAGSIVGRVVPNHVADRAGSINMVLVCGVAALVVLAGWFGIQNFAGLIVFALLYGCFSGGVVSLMPSVIISLTPDPGRVGARLGMNFLTTGVALLVGTPVAGAVLNGFGRSQWLGVIGYSTAGMLVGVSFQGLSRLLLWRTKGQIKA